MAIMLILTLTISAFNPEAEDSTHAAVKVAGDYSAVFPLLVVSVFLSLMASRDTIFYATQRARGDITAVPEVLCQPGMEGSPLVVGYVHSSDEISFGDSSSESDGHESDIEIGVSSLSREDHDTRAIDSVITQNDIEKTFAEVTSFNIGGETESLTQDDHHVLSTKADDIFAAAVSGGNVDIGLSSARLDELLGISQDADDEAIPVEPAHRRIQSAPFGVSMVQSRSRTTNYDETNTSAAASPPVAGNHGRTSSSISQKGVLVRVTSFGDIQDHQPSLMDQARMRSASSVAESHRRVPSLPNAPLIFATGDSTLRIHRRVPSSGRHSRKPSDASQLMLNSVSCHTGSEPGGALSLDDIEQSFSAVVNEKVGYDAFTNKSLWSAN